MYTCIIVDDQTEAVDLIKDHVIKIPLLTLLHATTDPVEALAFLDTSKPDIIFLDIEMPGISGLEFIESNKARWGNNIPKIVFTTGYSNYAINGYEQGVTDYLLKPISFIRFKKCIDRIIDDLDKQNKQPDKPAYFFVDDDGKKVKINFDTIIYIEGAGNYILIITSDAKKIIYKSMNSMEDILPRDKFMRVHKSYIVAANKILAIRGNQITLDFKNPDKVIPIGITYKENVLKKLGIN
jgi:two-component system LytT family response regulator